MLDQLIGQQEKSRETADVVDAPVVTAVSNSFVMLRCDSKNLNSREERLHHFGKEGAQAHSGSSHDTFALRRGQRTSFRKSVFATPDSSTWLPFGGTALRLVSRSKPKSGPQVFSLDDTSADYASAQRLLDRAVASFGDIRALLECLRSSPYHIPTLMHLSYAFAVQGDMPQSYEYLDMAAYSLGISMKTFPWEGTVNDRVLPYDSAANQLAYLVLHRIMHTSLRRGSPRTSLELCKLLLSLDDRDPKHVMLLLDYVALRSSQWGWFCDFYRALVAEGSPLLVLPSFHFSHALCLFFLESKGEPPAAQEAQAADARPDSVSALCDAMRIFPGTAIALAEAVGEKLMKEPWSQFVPALMASPSAQVPPTSQAALEHVTRLFVDRCAELWKPQVVVELLRAAASRVMRDEDVDRQVASARRNQLLALGALDVYSATAKDELMGETTRIPMDLLNPMRETEAEARESAARRTGGRPNTRGTAADGSFVWAPFP